MAYAKRNEYKRTINFKNQTLKQINKSLAKKLYDNDVEIYIKPNNKRPLSVWGDMPSYIKSKTDRSFEELTNEILYYTDKQFGRYLQYFVRLKDVR